MVSEKPGAGSLVVFRHGHIGRVTKVRGGRVYTNEGNTSALYGDSNGGTVKNKGYSVSDPNILGYCRMDYGEEGELPETQNPGENDFGEASPGISDRVEAFQRWLNVWYPGILKQHCGKPLKEDGIWGPETGKAALAVWKDILDRLYGCREVWKEPDFGSYCCIAAGKALVKRGDPGTLTAIAEGILAAGGYYKGNIDAVFGNGMERAVREFQEEHASTTITACARKRRWTGCPQNTAWQGSWWYPRNARPKGSCGSAMTPPEMPSPSRRAVSATAM